jgi:membrane protein implicated in regulation of membrane protease activity
MMTMGKRNFMGGPSVAEMESREVYEQWLATTCQDGLLVHNARTLLGEITLMGIANSGFWWLLAGGCVVLEMLTGTFYLLMLGLGFVAAALAAYAGLGLAAQVAAAALVGGGSVAVWHAVRIARARRTGEPTATEQSLDVGETLQIAQWDADGTASIHYRGARWTAVPRGPQPAQPGLHRIVGLVGNRLVVDKV